MRCSSNSLVFRERIQRMRKLSLLALPLLTVQSATYTIAFSADPEKPDSLTYAIAGSFDPANPAPQFGFLDIGTGTFQLIAGFTNGAQAIARDKGTILAVDFSNYLIRISPDGKATVVRPTGITTP